MLLRDARARGCGGDGAMKRGASGSGATGHRQTSELPQALNALRVTICSLCTAAVAVSVLVSGDCIYVIHSSLCLRAQCAYIIKAWYA